MPPEGYDTATLPAELIDQLDALNNMSRAATVEMLLSEYDDGERWKQAVSDDGVLEVSLSDGAARRIREDMNAGGEVTLEASERKAIAREVAEVLR